MHYHLPLRWFSDTVASSTGVPKPSYSIGCDHILTLQMLFAGSISTVAYGQVEMSSKRVFFILPDGPWVFMPWSYNKKPFCVLASDVGERVIIQRPPRVERLQHVIDGVISKSYKDVRLGQTLVIMLHSYPIRWETIGRATVLKAGRELISLRAKPKPTRPSTPHTGSDAGGDATVPDTGAAEDDDVDFDIDDEIGRHMEEGGDEEPAQGGDDYGGEALDFPGDWASHFPDEAVLALDEHGFPIATRADDLDEHLPLLDELAGDTLCYMTHAVSKCCSCCCGCNAACSAIVMAPECACNHSDSILLSAI